MTLNSKRALTVAIDTSTDMLVCALRWTDLETGEEHMLSRDHMCRRHANVELVNTVQAALTEAGFGIADVDAIVVGRGPGSFTGVRIGISTAKGLACGANVPLLGASTLDACAWTAWRAGERGLVGSPMPCAARSIRRCIALTRRARSACLTASAWLRLLLLWTNGASVPTGQRFV